jgi:hypothetical protein
LLYSTFININFFPSYLVYERCFEVFLFLNILLSLSRWSFLWKLQNLLKLMRLLESMMLRLVCFSLGFTLIWKLVINSWRFTGCCLLLKYDVYFFLSVSSRHSRSLAEDAFFHPSIMSISYYSFEHCFAIYSVRPLTLSPSH